MISEHDFSQEGADDFTNDFTASLEQDYITLFMYQKGHEYDPITDHRRKKRCEDNRKALPVQLHGRNVQNIFNGHRKKILF
jgi:hypothetical protein